MSQQPEALPFAVFDEFGNGADDRVQDHIRAQVERLQAGGHAARYRFLMALLIDRGVLTDKRYNNGTWTLQGIYGVDDSGLRGAGRTPEEAIDNAIIMASLNPDDRLAKWRKVTQSSPAPVAAGRAMVPLTTQQIVGACGDALLATVRVVRATEAAHGINGLTVGDGGA